MIMAEAEDEPEDGTESNDKEGDKKQGKSGEKDKPRTKRPVFIVAAIVVVGAVIGFFFWFARRNEVRTDDAYTDGNGVTMAPKISGYVVALDINDNMRVRRG